MTVPRERSFRPRWTSTQLAGGMALALLAGLAIGYGGRAGSNSSPSPSVATAGSGSSSSSLPTVTGNEEPPLLDLPPEPAAARPPEVPTTALPAVAPVTGSPLPTTPVPAVPSTPTTLASGPQAPADGAGERVLLNVRSSGSKRTQQFAVGAGGWRLGWGYDCSRSPGSRTFSLKVLNADGTPGQEAAVARSDPKTSGVEQYQTSGDRMLEITTSCVWEVKVVGVGA